MNANTNAVLMFSYVWFLVLAWAVVTPVMAVIASLNESYYLLWGTMLIVAGITFLVPVGSIYWRYRRLRIQGEAAATVTDYIKHTDSDGDSYFPCFEFTVEGKVYNVQSRATYSNYNPKYQTGDNVKIHYNPNAPQNAEIDDRFASRLMFILTCVFFLVIVVGVLFFVFQTESFGEIFSKVWDLFF